MTAAVRFTAVVYNVICVFWSEWRLAGTELNSASVQSPCSTPMVPVLVICDEGRGPGHIAVHRNTWFGGRFYPFFCGQINHSELFGVVHGTQVLLLS